MANLQNKVKLYYGTEEEDFNNFKNFFRRFVAVSGMNNEKKPNFLHLHLHNGALRFFHTLTPATQANSDDCFTPLRDQFANRNLQEVRVSKLRSQRFDPKTDTLEYFLVNQHTKALRAYPEPNLPEVAPLNFAGLAPALDVAEQTRFDRETTTRDAQLQAVESFKKSFC